MREPALCVVAVLALVAAFIVAGTAEYKSAASQADGNLERRAVVPMLVRSANPPDPTPIPTATPMPTPTVPTSPLGTRSNPYPVGTEVEFAGSWHVTVLSVTSDATDLVLAENIFNEPPTPGRQFFIAHVRARYSGGGTDNFDGNFRLRAVGASAVGVTTFENSCGVVPNELPDPDVFAGGMLEGNVCWEIRSDDADSMVLYDDPFLEDPIEQFVSLLPPGVPPPAVSGPAGRAPDPAPGVGTRQNPVPIGQAIPFPDGWNVSVVGIDEDATAEVLAENPFNDPPSVGHRFFIVRIRATRAAEGMAEFDGDFRLRAVGAAAVVWTTFNNSCGVVPDALPDSDVFPGGTITGNICFEVPNTDVGTLVLLDHPFLVAGSPYFAALH